MRNPSLRLLASTVSILSILVLFSLFTSVLSLSDPSDDSMIEQSKQLLLQKGLTLYQIDEEVARLDLEEGRTARNISNAERDIERQNVRVAEKREHAGKVLRAYYMGERKTLLLSVFSIRSWNDALMVFQYLDVIAASDQRKLKTYVAEYRELQSLHTTLLAKQDELQRIKQQFLFQRQRLVALQAELDGQLLAHPEVKEQIDNLTKQWETKGKPLFDMYLTSLTEAMTQIPQLIEEDSSTLSTRGSTIVFEISDTKLNAFLLGQNELFRDFTFHFEQDLMVVGGNQGDVEALIRGKYTLETEPENLLRFSIDEMIFNGFSLDETTKSAFIKQFDESLAFHPQRILPYIEATGVTIKPGKFVLEMKLAGKK